MNALVVQDIRAHVSLIEKHINLAIRRERHLQHRINALKLLLLQKGPSR